MSVFLYFQTPDSFSPYVEPRFPHISEICSSFLFFAESVCAVCERERVQAAQSAGVGQREGVSARGTVSDAGAGRRRAPQLKHQRVKLAPVRCC